MNNPLKNTRVEFHILQSFPVTCLNRDDVGAPKTAVIGGSTRARVSSQCWKRQVRMELHNLGVSHGKRTKLIGKLIHDACLDLGANPDQAKACGEKLEQVFIKKKTSKDTDNLDSEASPDKSDTLIFLSPKEIGKLAKAFAEHDFIPEAVITQKDPKKQAKEVSAIIGDLKQQTDALDVALFGRMVAQAAELNMEAAASFSHSISTHKVSNEIEFFTAMDDLQTDVGAAHMGSLEFNSATYYRYISLDLGQLYQSLAGQNLPEAVAAFTQALFTAIPSARQSNQSGASAWEFARVLVRKGQRLQVPFETAVKAENGGFLQPSIVALSSYLDKKQKLAGSLFGKIADYRFGEDENFSIDDLISALKQHASIPSNA